MRAEGQVFDNDMRPISRANVTNVSTGVSVPADSDGAFSIEVSGEGSLLKFQHAGYDYDTISVAELQANGGMVQLWPTSIDEVIVHNGAKKDNTLLYLGLAAVAGVAIYKLAGAKSPRKVTV